jgi:serine phosphatase RsbU (regulator of sigma subunit)
MSLSYASAGHPDAFIISRSGKVRVSLESTGLPLGVLNGESFPAGPQAEFQTGDTLLLLTDGVLEAASPEGEAFGVARAIEVVRQNGSLSAAELIETLYRQVRDFAKEAPVDDDITAVVVKVA